MQQKLIAYLIQAHHQPAHFYDLVCQLNHKEVCFFVHIDKKSNQENFKNKVNHLRNVFFVQNRINVVWAGFSQVQATLSMIALALNSVYNFKYFVLLSGVCYPIKSNNYIIKFFQNNKKNYIDTIKINEEYQKYKYLYYMLSLKCINKTNRYAEQYQQTKTKYFYYQYKIFSFITDKFIIPKRKWQQCVAYYNQHERTIGRGHYWMFYN
jgi:hypothetical protein